MKYNEIDHKSYNGNATQTKTVETVDMSTLLDITDLWYKYSHFLHLFCYPSHNTSLLTKLAFVIIVIVLVTFSS